MPTGAQATPIDSRTRVATAAVARGRQGLDAAEKAAIATRRVAAKLGADLPRAGLALSGGGVRSATFCLGLIRGLAQNGVLRRFDYLSTVSGGGYAGSSLGRIAATHGIDTAESQLAAGDSIVLAWLRRNGRYLTPEGARDIGMAVATYLRGGLSTHLELGFLALLVGLVAIAPHVVQTVLPLFDAQSWHSWWSGWWPIGTAFWLLFAPGGIVAFWPLRESETAPGRTASRLIPRGELSGLIIVCAIGVVLTRPSLVLDLSSPGLIGAPSVRSAGFLIFVGALMRLLSLSARLYGRSLRPPLDAFAMLAYERNRLTRSLRRVNEVTAVLFLLGLLDLLTWAGMRKLGHVGSTWMAGGIGLGGLVALLLRAFSEPLQKISASADGVASRWLPQIINAVGTLIGLLVLAAWVLLLQWLVFATPTIALLQFLPPVARASLVLAAVLAWYALTLHHRETVNASSLHGFYQARLTRAYLSLGNTNRFPDIGRKSMAGTAADEIESVTRVAAGDDVALDAYSPEAKGGPIHLISACLNQTVDDHGELYNADRKGTAVVASARGLEIGTATVVEAAPGSYGTLGHWVAISGAATSPGAGSYTTTGWSLLLFLAGARLGYWVDAGALQRGSDAGAGMLTYSLARVSAWLQETKPGLLACEALASFGGRTRNWWYLSDGGHFDNTGVYTLLRRELEFIMLADCGADAKFEFADLENLVRKARIDFDAEIELYTRSEAQALLGAGTADLCVLAPEDMLDNASVRGILLARICYHRSDSARRKLGTLLIVKPNLHESLDNDVLAYARRNPAFPQQSTADQFFDEAQWESYHHLGEDFGRALTDAWLRTVPGWSKPVAMPAQITPLRRAAAAVTPADGQKSVPFWRRGVGAAALGTTLGLGAIGTLLLPAWQVMDDLQKQRSAQDAQDAAQKQSVNKELDRIEAKVREVIAKAPTIDADDGTARKLASLYDATLAFPGDPQLRYVQDLVGDVQAACGLNGSTCSDKPSATPLLCGAVCTNPVHREADPYWEYPKDQDEVWQQNVLVHVAQDWGLLQPPPQVAVASVQPARPAAAASPTPPSPPPLSSPPPPAPTAPVSLPLPPMDTNPASAPSMAAATPPTHADPVPDTVAPPLVMGMATAISAVARTRAVPPPLPTATASTAVQPCFATNADSVERSPITIFVQIYDETMRPRVDSLRSSQTSAAVRFAGTENVTRTAAARGDKPAAQWHQPTLIVHRSSDLVCAHAVADQLAEPVKALYAPGVDAQIRVRGLPSSFHSDRHVLELWLPASAWQAAE